MDVRQKVIKGINTYLQFWKGQPVIDYNPPTGPDYTEPFYVENVSDDVMTLVITNSRYYTSYPNVEKSTDKINWETVGIPYYKAPLNISIPIGGKLYLRSKVDYWGPSRSNGGPAYMYSTSNYNVGGNIMSLLQGSNFAGTKGELISVNNNAFYGLFNNSGNKLIDASKLLLPSNTSVSCYQNMFQDCDSLIYPPVLPATTLAGGCYINMFSHCTSLITASELPATTLVNDCYYRMFYSCKSLTTAPELPATTLANYCYTEMFSGCTHLNYIKCLATNISAGGCVSNWVTGVASTGTFVKNPSMSGWPTSSGSGIPSGWTVQDA